LTLERRGVPTVGLHAAAFAQVVEAVLDANGAPHAPRAFLPQPLAGRPRALGAYVEGDDSVQGRPLMEAVLDGLTRPPARDGTRREAPPPRLLADGEDGLRTLFLERGWTDGLPIVLPTIERVEAMLAHTRHDRDEVVVRLSPTNHRAAWEVTVETVAVNAVLAGALPEHLPLVLALAASGVSARHSSTTSLAGMALVNGPVRHELGLNAGIGALGPYNRANATIGRAWGLASQNGQGGSAPGITYMGSQGNAYAYGSLCFAENEEGSPWEPLHVQHGFAREESVVTAFLGGRTTGYSGAVRDATWASTLRRALVAGDPTSGPVLLLDPLAAHRLVELGGFAEKRRLAEWMAEAAVLPASEYWDLFEVRMLYHARALAGEEPWASTLAAAPETQVRLFEPGAVEVVVVGGETTPSWRLIGAAPGTSVSVDRWR
jgi:hypothetical protein